MLQLLQTQWIEFSIMDRSTKRLRGFSMLLDSMSVDIACQTAQRREHLMRLTFVRFQRKSIHPGNGKCDFQGVDRIKAETIAKQLFVRLNFIRRLIEMQSIDQKLSNFIFGGRTLIHRDFQSGFSCLTRGAEIASVII
jgi:hypothetical protein